MTPPHMPAAKQPEQEQEQEQEAGAARKQRIKTLFLRYPNISSDERREIVAYLKTGPLLEIGLLKGDETIRYRIAAFEQEQQKALARSPMDLVVMIVLLVGAAVVCSALWDMGA